MPTIHVEPTHKETSNCSSDAALPKENLLDARLETSHKVLKERLGFYQPKIGIILGSGLGPLAECIQDAVYVPFAEVPFMKTSTASSHVGRFVCGTLAGKCVLAMQGRLHGYEGNEAWEVAYPVWLMHRLGIETLITTNAAGAINESYRVGDFCIMEDHINLTGRNPLVGTDPNGMAPRFAPMNDAYDPNLRTVAKAVAEKLSIRVQEGVYLGLLGPSFETPAEIRAFRSLDYSKAHQIISAYDKNAIEAAAQLAAANDGQVVVISAATTKATDAKLKKDILSRGVDELFMA